MITNAPIDALGNTTLIRAIFENRSVEQIRRTLEDDECTFSETNDSLMNCLHYLGNQPQQFIHNVFHLFDIQHDAYKLQAIVQQDCSGKSPLYNAMIFDNRLLFESLLNRGAPLLSFEEGGTWKSLLTFLMQKNPSQILELLLNSPQYSAEFSEHLDEHFAWLSSNTKTSKELLTLRTMKAKSKLTLTTEALDQLNIEQLLNIQNALHVPLTELTLKARVGEIAENIVEAFEDTLDQTDETLNTATRIDCR
jgi:hypothetical protein